MVASQALRLADLIAESLGEDVGGAEGPGAGSSAAPSGTADLRGVSADLSALLVELARAPEAEVDVASGWTPGIRPGDEVGRFLLRREIGRGAIGVVFEAYDRDVGRAVAFKALRPGRRLARRSASELHGEAEAAARLDHPNIVALRDFGRGPGGPYLVFELLAGETLAERLRRGPLPLREAIAVARDVARGLAHAHAAGAVHRDLEPDNVFLCRDGTVKVLDFGLAHLFGRAGAVAGGTPAYIAPEQWRNEVGDERTDLFALGVLLYEMITGRVPYRASRDATETSEPGPPPLLPGEAPAALRRLAAALLEKDPARRPRSTKKVARAFAAVQRLVEGGRSTHLAAWSAAIAAAAALL